jgi:hypothetical protein
VCSHMQLHSVPTISIVTFEIMSSLVSWRTGFLSCITGSLSAHNCSKANSSYSYASIPSSREADKFLSLSLQLEEYNYMEQRPCEKLIVI